LRAKQGRVMPPSLNKYRFPILIELKNFVRMENANAFSMMPNIRFAVVMADMQLAQIMKKETYKVCIKFS
jgi:hypothetical protein